MPGQSVGFMLYLFNIYIIYYKINYLDKASPQFENGHIKKQGNMKYMDFEKVIWIHEKSCCE